MTITGAPPADPQNLRLANAADHLADLMCNMRGMGEVFDRFTCSEVEAIADVLRLVGRDDAADIILGEHASGDDGGDMHYHLNENRTECADKKNGYTCWEPINHDGGHTYEKDEE